VTEAACCSGAARNLYGPRSETLRASRGEEMGGRSPPQLIRRSGRAT